jgi:hypothetical protein
MTKMWKSQILLVGMKNNTDHLENSLAVPIMSNALCDPEITCLNICPIQIKMNVYIKTCMKIFITALFSIARIKYLVTGKWISKS